MIMELIDEAVAAGARQEPACEILGLSARTIQRWREEGGGEDRRQGPDTEPANKLSTDERQELLAVVNSPKFRDLPPAQIVVRLADEQRYLASPSTIYRILREEQQLAHRERSRPASPRQKPREHVATGPCQVWSWDITYLPGPVRGRFFYLYLILDVWSRKIVGAEVHEHECSDLAAEVFTRACESLNEDPEGIVLHSDNGSPMKGATMLATLQALGVVTSFSRPRVSNDNPYSEALFRTLKYRPEYPRRFDSLTAACSWVASFVRWYNTEHLHSAIRYVTPDDRHYGREEELLRKRRQVYEEARRRQPKRWTGPIRNWTPVATVYLNPADRLAA